MPSKKPRLVLTIDQQVFDFLEKLADSVDLPVSGIVVRVLSGQLVELTEYYEWLNGLQEERMKLLGKNLMLSYGPESLTDGIRRLDPTYKLVGDKLLSDAGISTK